MAGPEDHVAPRSRGRWRGQQIRAASWIRQPIRIEAVDPAAVQRRDHTRDQPVTNRKTQAGKGDSKRPGENLRAGLIDHPTAVDGFIDPGLADDLDFVPQDVAHKAPQGRDDLGAVLNLEVTRAHRFAWAARKASRTAASLNSLISKAFHSIVQALPDLRFCSGRTYHCFFGPE